MNLKRKILNNAIKFLNVFALDKLYVRTQSKHGISILMYHSVSTESDAAFIDPSNSIVEPLFDYQMNYLQQNCNVISLNEMFTLIEKQKKIPARTVVITFDDGYKNNLTTAIPILDKYNLPATIFLATKYIDLQLPQWIDEIYCIFKYRQKNNLQINDLGITNTITLTSENESSLYKSIGQLFITSSFEQRSRWISELYEQLDPNINFPKLSLSWEDIATIIEKHPSITIASHTEDHVDLSQLNSTEVRKQINNSIRRIQDKVNVDVDFFTYPYGRASKTAVKEVRNLGLKLALVTEPFSITTLESDRYEVARVASPNSKIFFKHIVSGAYPSLARYLFKRI